MTAAAAPNRVHVGFSMCEVCRTSRDCLCEEIKDYEVHPVTYMEQAYAAASVRLAEYGEGVANRSTAGYGKICMSDEEFSFLDRYVSIAGRYLAQVHAGVLPCLSPKKASQLADELSSYCVVSTASGPSAVFNTVDHSNRFKFINDSEGLGYVEPWERSLYARVPKTSVRVSAIAKCEMLVKAIVKNAKKHTDAEITAKRAMVVLSRLKKDNPTCLSANASVSQIKQFCPDVSTSSISISAILKKCNRPSVRFSVTKAEKLCNTLAVPKIFVAQCAIDYAAYVDQHGECEIAFEAYVEAAKCGVKLADAISLHRVGAKVSCLIDGLSIQVGTVCLPVNDLTV